MKRAIYITDFGIFNSITVNVRYSCMNNMSKIIKRHNKKVTLKSRDQKPKCNCRKKEESPMEGNCQINDVVYKYDATRPLLQKVYFGFAEEAWKRCFYNQKLSFKHKIFQWNNTFKLYVSSDAPNLKWFVLRCVPPYSNISRKCFMYLYEKLAIITYQNQKELLNKTSELFCKCRHANKFLIKNYSGNDFR